MQSLSGYSVYDGWQVQGWPKFVIRRGQLVLADGQITARPGDGEWLRRTTTARALPPGPGVPYRLASPRPQLRIYRRWGTPEPSHNSALAPHVLRRSVLSAALCG
jgi:hypothetical protein